MKEFITIIINEKLKVFFRQKGQGLVEIALILALCAGIGLAAREMGFLDVISSVFDFGEQPEYVTAAIGGGTGGNPGGNTGDNPGGNTGDNPGGNTGDNPGGNTGDNPGGNTGDNPGGNTGDNPSGNNGDNPGGNTGDNPGGNTGGGGLVDWGAQNPYSYFEDGVSQEERLAKDQEALVNIAKHFIGLTQAEVKALLNNNTADMGEKNKEVLLGHLVPDGEGGMRFNANGALSKLEAQNIFAWMQGIQNTSSTGEKDKYGAVINDNYDPTRMYLVSDYVVSQNWVKDLGIVAGSNQENGLRLRLEYDYFSHTDPSDDFAADQVRVIGVQLSIDPRSQTNTELGQTAKYNRMSSLGLNVQVKWDGKDENGNDKYITSYNNNGIPQDSSSSGSGDGMYNWYGEGDYRLVQAYIASQATTIDNTASEVKEFTKGQIIYVPGKNSYYIAKKDGTQSISNTNVPEYAPNNNNVLVKFQTDDYRYWHENDKSNFVSSTHSFEPKFIKARGTVLTMDNGDIYVYVGDKTSNSNNIPFKGIDDDWIQIRGQSQSGT